MMAIKRANERLCKDLTKLRCHKRFGVFSGSIEGMEDGITISMHFRYI
jgi:hypothetical protein